MGMFRFIVFLTVFISVYLVVHYYLYFSFTRDFSLGQKTKNRIRLFFLLSALSYVLARTLERRGIPMYYLLVYGSVWMGFVSISFSCFIIKDTAALFFKSIRKQLTNSAVIAAVLLSIYSLINGLSDPVFKNIEIASSKLQSGSSIKIVQLSDMHLDSMSSSRRLKRIVKLINELKVDVVLITGDLLDANVCDYQRFCGPLGGLESEYGVYAVTGNHEYYVGVDIFMDVARRSGIKVLRNALIDIGGSVQLAGVDDYSGKFKDRDINALSRTLEAADKGKYVILMAHKPLHFAEAAKLGVDLQLSGHTHRGQIPAIDFFVWLLYEYPYGLHNIGESHIYTTAGTSTWGPPMRLFSRSEVPVFKIRGK